MSIHAHVGSSVWSARSNRGRSLKRYCRLWPSTEFQSTYAVITALSLSHTRSNKNSKTIIKTLYIEPGSPWQNGFIESFHSRFRDECLNREWLLNLGEARIVIEDWRLHYNKQRPHSQLGYISPDEFRLNQKVSPQVGQNG